MRKIPTLVLACVVLLLGGCGETEAEREVTQLPRVALPEIREIIAGADAADQVLILDFWATWCIPCVEMYPLLHEQFSGKPGVKIVSITLDSPDLEEQALKFLREHGGLKDAYMLMPDSDAQAAVTALSSEWNNLVVPAILVYDTDGQLSQAFIGASDPAPEVRRIVEHVRELRGEEPQSMR